MFVSLKFFLFCLAVTKHNTNIFLSTIFRQVDIDKQKANIVTYILDSTNIDMENSK